jgi:hypothetical protein
MLYTILKIGSEMFSNPVCQHDLSESLRGPQSPAQTWEKSTTRLTMQSTGINEDRHSSSPRDEPGMDE